MPIWLLIVCCVLGIIVFCMLVHIILCVFVGLSVRDNIVFKNKYKRKIYQLNEKLEKIEEKIKERISYLEYKSIYCENIKILHEKDLNSTILFSSEDFIKYEKVGKTNKKK